MAEVSVPTLGLTASPTASFELGLSPFKKAIPELQRDIPVLAPGQQQLFNAHIEAWEAGKAHQLSATAVNLLSELTDTLSTTTSGIDKKKPGRFADLPAAQLLAILKEMHRFCDAFGQGVQLVDNLSGDGEKSTLAISTYIETQHSRLVALVNEGIQCALTRLTEDAKKSARLPTKPDNNFLLSGIASLVATNGTRSQREQLNALLSHAKVGVALNPETGSWQFPSFDAWQARGIGMYQRFYRSVFEITKSHAVVYQAFWQCTQALTSRPATNLGEVTTRLTRFSEIELGLRQVQAELKSKAAPWWVRALDWWHGHNFSIWKNYASTTLTASIDHLDTLRVKTIEPVLAGVVSGKLELTPKQLENLSNTLSGLLKRLEKHPGSKPLTALRELQAQFRVQFAELELAAKKRLDEMSAEAVALNTLKQLEAGEIVHDDRIIAMGGFYRSLQIEKPSAYALVAKRIDAIIEKAAGCLEMHLNAPIESDVPMAALKSAHTLIRYQQGKKTWQEWTVRALPVLNQAWLALSQDGANVKSPAFEKAGLIGDEVAQDLLKKYRDLCVTDKAAAHQLANDESARITNQLFVDSGAASQQFSLARVKFNGAVSALIEDTQSKLEATVLRQLMTESERESSQPWLLTECRFLGVTFGSTVNQATISNETNAWRYHLLSLSRTWQTSATQLSHVRDKGAADALIKNTVEKTRSWVAVLPRAAKAVIGHALEALPTTISWIPPRGLLPVGNEKSNTKHTMNHTTEGETPCLAQ